MDSPVQPTNVPPDIFCCAGRSFTDTFAHAGTGEYFCQVTASRPGFPPENDDMAVAIHRFVLAGAFVEQPDHRKRLCDFPDPAPDGAAVFAETRHGTFVFAGLCRRPIIRRANAGTILSSDLAFIRPLAGLLERPCAGLEHFLAAVVPRRHSFYPV